MIAGTIIDVKGRGEATVVYNNLDGVGVIWGNLKIDITDLPMPDAMLRNDYKNSFAECLGDDIEYTVVHVPKIVCLCGSTRFMDAFFEEGWKKTLQGEIVLSVGVVKSSKGHAGEEIGQDCANMLDELHKRKIDISDYVLVLNVGGYIGESTRAEINYAKGACKPVWYLEDINKEPK